METITNNIEKMKIETDANVTTPNPDKKLKKTKILIKGTGAPPYNPNTQLQKEYMLHIIIQNGRVIKNMIDMTLRREGYLNAAQSLHLICIYTEREIQKVKYRGHGFSYTIRNGGTLFDTSKRSQRNNIKYQRLANTIRYETYCMIQYVSHLIETYNTMM
jgi:hypothetical protein